MPDEKQDRDDAPFPQPPDDEHTEFIDDPASASDGDESSEGAQAGIGAGATEGADDPEAHDGEQAGAEEAEVARKPRGAPVN